MKLDKNIVLYFTLNCQAIQKQKFDKLYILILTKNLLLLSNEIKGSLDDLNKTIRIIIIIILLNNLHTIFIPPLKYRNELHWRCWLSPKNQHRNLFIIGFKNMCTAHTYHTYLYTTRARILYDRINILYILTITNQIPIKSVESFSLTNMLVFNVHTAIFMKILSNPFKY